MIIFSKTIFPLTKPAPVLYNKMIHKREVTVISKLQKKRTFPHKYALIFFFSMIVYSIVFVRKFTLPHVDGITYLFHCVDYSYGFCSKFFTGAVYHLFFKETSQLTADIFQIILLLLSLAGVSLLLEKFIENAPAEHKSTALWLIAFFITGPATFSMFSYELGMLDVWWIPFTVLFIVFLKNRYLKWISPVFGALSVLVHFGAILTYVPLYALLALYETGSAKVRKEKIKNGIIFGLVCVFSLGAFAYFGANDSKNVTYSLQEFDERLHAQNAEKISYFETLLYGNNSYTTDEFNDVTGIYDGYSEDFLNEYISIDCGIPVIGPAINAIARTLKIHFLIYTKDENFIKVFCNLTAELILLLPLIILLSKCFFKKKKGSTRLIQFYSFCAALIVPLAVIATFFVSTDSVRWLGHGVLSLFTVLLYECYSEGFVSLPYFSEKLKKYGSMATAVYFTVYLLCSFDPYV